MKPQTESVYYHAYYDEIWLRPRPTYITRGCQAKIRVPGQIFFVRDYLELYEFKVDLKKWSQHTKNGWLIVIGKL